jgi:hypothetical protein
MRAVASITDNPLLIDRYRTLGGPAADAMRLKLLPPVLSLIAGSADVIGFLGLGGLFVAHIASLWGVPLRRHGPALTKLRANRAQEPHDSVKEGPA